MQAATTGVLPNSTAYSNGAAGVGASLTAGVLDVPLTVDGYSPILNERVLVKNQATPAQNGVYFLSQVAAVGLPWVLTRALDYNTPSNINNTGAIPVTKGTANLDTSWVLTSQVATVGTDPLTYTQFTVNPANLLANVLTAGHLFVGNGSNLATDTPMSGDATISSAGALALAAIITPGSIGDATHVPVLTYDAKGRLTAVATATITPASFKARIAANESPDGVNTVFTLPDNYVAGSLTAYLNGVAESNVSETDSHTFTFSSAPLSGWTVRASYVFSSVFVPPGGGPLGPSLGLANF